MARGDRRVGQALLEAHRLGCRLDGWDEYFNYEKWLEAFRCAGLDPNFYTTRGFGTDELLPWQTIDVGVTTKFLLHEREKHCARKQRRTAVRTATVVARGC